MASHLSCEIHQTKFKILVSRLTVNVELVIGTSPAFTKHLQGGRYSELRRERCIMLKTYAHEPIGQVLVSA
jgi:hypothetical protein